MYRTAIIKPSIHILLLLFLCLFSCGGKAVEPASRSHRTVRDDVGVIGYTIQVGAFSNQNNAVRLTEKLNYEGLNAYHFVHSSGLYKVRFGNFRSKKTARKAARRLLSKGVIGKYYIVGPKDRPRGKDLRESIVASAKQFLGVSYRWGGTSSRTGFDCSGLTSAVYRQNGLALPRSSIQQWKVGKYVKRRQLKKGDLVFFKTYGRKKVSHVGIYIGENRFIHSPGKGRSIRIVSLDQKYYRKRYVGARRYF